ncbi:hypothetical protein EDD17DRAFT_1898525 [Pisolithus thermaeus]|nr:hypothetical protein EDD17DRAFT_1898525 [Pisolithus thermaeus]
MQRFGLDGQQPTGKIRSFGAVVLDIMGPKAQYWLDLGDRAAIRSFVPERFHICKLTLGVPPPGRAERKAVSVLCQKKGGQSAKSVIAAGCNLAVDWHLFACTGYLNLNAMNNNAPSLAYPRLKRNAPPSETARSPEIHGGISIISEVALFATVSSKQDDSYSYRNSSNSTLSIPVSADSHCGRGQTGIQALGLRTVLSQSSSLLHDIGGHAIRLADSSTTSARCWDAQKEFRKVMRRKEKIGAVNARFASSSELSDI